MSDSLTSESSHRQTLATHLSSASAWSVLGTSVYDTGDVPSVGSSICATSAANVATKICSHGWGRGELIMCMNPYDSLIQSSSASGSGLLPGCGGRHDRPSRPCRVPGTWTSLKWKVRIARIQWLMLALGLRLGLANISLIYRASTSITRFRIPIKYSFSRHSKQYKPYNSSFSWEKCNSRLLSVINPNLA